MKPEIELILKSAKTKLPAAEKEDDLKITKDDLKSALKELRAAWDSGDAGVEEFLAARDIANHVK